MTDSVSAERSENMRRIRSKDTKIELALRKALWSKGYRYRKNYAILPGKPDIAMTKYKIAIFCDSEFFHGKDWEILRPQLEKEIMASSGLKKYPETENVMMKSTRHCCFGDGRLFAFGGRIF